MKIEKKLKIENNCIYIFFSSAKPIKKNWN